MTSSDKKETRLHGLLCALILLLAALLLRAATPDPAGHGTAMRAFGILTAVILMFYANAVPKRLLPLARLRQDPVAEQALRRYTGWAMVLAGAGELLIWLFAPIGLAFWCALALVVAALAAIAWKCAALRAPHAGSAP